MDTNEKIVKIIHGYSYVSLEQIKSELNVRECFHKSETINHYLSSLKKKEKIFDAGRNWYSKIENEFILDLSPVEEMKNNILSTFPFLEFNLWNIKQINQYFNHLSKIDFIFLFVSREAMDSVTEALNTENHTIYKNPSKLVINDYIRNTQKSIIIRPLVTEEPVEEQYSRIEKILVDLFIENENFCFFDYSEYKNIFFNVIDSGRVNIAKILRYSQRRGIKNKIISSIFENQLFLK